MVDVENAVGGMIQGGTKRAEEAAEEELALLCYVAELCEKNRCFVPHQKCGFLVTYSLTYQGHTNEKCGVMATATSGPNP